MKIYSPRWNSSPQYRARLYYTSEQRNRINVIRDLLDSAFKTESITVNYYKTYVKIVMEDARVKNSILAATMRRNFKDMGVSIEVKDNFTIIKMKHDAIGVDNPSLVG